VPRDWHSAKFEFLPRARAQHSAKKPFFLKKIFLKIVFAEWYHLALGKIDLFAECQAVALGKTGEVAVFYGIFSQLCRVPHPWHSAKTSLPSVGTRQSWEICYFFCLLLSFESKHAKLIYNT